MPAVGDQRGRADPAPGPDPVAGHQLVPGEAEGGRDGHSGQVGDWPGVQQALDRGERGHGAGDRDDRDDGHAGQILGPAVPVGVPAGRAAPAEHEGHPERDRGQRVGRVVQRVAEQRDRTRQRDHHRLRGGRGGQPGQRDPQGAPAVGRFLKCRVGAVVVRMGPDRVPDAVPDAVPVVVAVLVAHVPRMSDKPHRSTSTPASASRCEGLGRGRRARSTARSVKKTMTIGDGRSPGGTGDGRPDGRGGGRVRGRAERGAARAGVLRVRRGAARLVVPACADRTACRSARWTTASAGSRTS